MFSFLYFALLMLLGAWEISGLPWLAGLFVRSSYVFFLVLSMVGLWIGYRIVNYSKFADFLIAVEAEMNKVSWPTRKELWRSAVVVIFVIFAMAFLLFVFDVAWSALFKTIGIRYIAS